MTVIAYMKNGQRKEWTNIIGIIDSEKDVSEFHLNVIEVMSLEGDISYIDKSKLERLVVKP